MRCNPDERETCAPFWQKRGLCTNYTCSLPPQRHRTRRALGTPAGYTAMSATQRLLAEHAGLSAVLEANPAQAPSLVQTLLDLTHAARWSQVRVVEIPSHTGHASASAKEQDGARVAPAAGTLGRALVCGLRPEAKGIEAVWCCSIADTLHSDLCVRPAETSRHLGLLPPVGHEDADRPLRSLLLSSVLPLPVPIAPPRFKQIFAALDALDIRGKDPEQGNEDRRAYTPAMTADNKDSALPLLRHHFFLAVLAQDATVVYYNIARGLVKPVN